MKYKILATYHAEVELIIEGAPGADMKDPKNWGDFEDERQLDYYLYDVTHAVPLTEE